MTNDEVRSTHESFGLISFSRPSCGGGGMTFFGSAIKHNHYITLTISRAELIRDYHHDRYYPKEQLVEVRMSNTQFAEAITTMGCGAGVPCTIEYIGREKMGEPPFKNERELIRNEFAQKMQKVTKEFKRGAEKIQELLEKKTVGKEDRRQINDVVSRLIQELGANVPFVTEMFDETIDKTITQAKGEIEAFYTHAIVAAGLETLQASKPTLQEVTYCGDSNDKA